MNGPVIRRTSPQIAQPATIPSIMLDVIVALIPALLMAVFLFGVRVLALTAVSVGTCVLAEYGYRRLRGLDSTVGDLSACVTGLLLAMSLPVTAPYWAPVLGGLFAIVIVKQFYGGLGRNFLNPALAGRTLLCTFPGLMTRWVDAFQRPGLLGTADAVTSATPMAVLHTGALPDLTLSQMLLELFLTLILPIGLMAAMLVWLMRRMSKGGGMMGIGKSNAKMYMEKETGVTFQDVAGEDEAKESLQEVVDFLHNPGKYSGIGAKLPKGALLVGPPGTGKTLLAKAVAGEAKVPFFSLSGSAFVEMYVGVGASRVRDLFKQAQQQAPCIVFIDEIDAIGKTRDTTLGGNDEREQTLNQLLAEMDGFDTNKGLLILAATNRPEILDPALLRPGRFDRRIIVDKPDLRGRVDILKVHAKDVRMDESVDLEAIALATSGAVGSDLANMINEAAINAVKHGRQVVSQKDLFEAVEVVLVGKEKKDRIMSKEERRIVSYHEVGHALVTALQKNTEPVQKITIVPRTMGALGYVMQTPEEEKFLNTKKELEAMIVVALGGRAAEELVFDTVTTGAANDIEQATKIARAMITQYGMSDRFGLMGLESIQNRYLDGRAVLNCGDATAGEIDEEVMKMLKAAYAEAKRLLADNREALDRIADFLIEKETITGKEFMKIFREVKGLPEPEETDGEGQPEETGRIAMKPVEN